MVEKVDINEKGFCLGGYFRIRVSMDIIQTLCKGRLVHIGGHRRLGLISNMRGYPSSATGVGRWTMMRETAFSGYVVKRNVGRRLSNSVHGCVQLRIDSKGHNWSSQQSGVT